MQKTVSEAETALTKLLEEKNALAVQLEEEKRKCEDLLFRFEEESVNKDDIQVQILIILFLLQMHLHVKTFTGKILDTLNDS